MTPEALARIADVARTDQEDAQASYIDGQMTKARFYGDEETKQALNQPDAHIQQQQIDNLDDLKYRAGSGAVKAVDRLRPHDAVSEAELLRQRDEALYLGVQDLSQ